MLTNDQDAKDNDDESDDDSDGDIKRISDHVHIQVHGCFCPGEARPNQ